MTAMTASAPRGSRMVNAPRRFYLHRTKDVSGMSGTGAVATGVAFPDDGKVVLRWCSDHSDIHQVSIFDSIDDVARIHGHSGCTKVVWIDLAPENIRSEPITTPSLKLRVTSWGHEHHLQQLFKKVDR